MADAVTLDFIAAQIERVLTEQRDMRATVDMMAVDIVVLQRLYLQIARDIEHTKRLFGQHDARLTKLET